MVLSMFRPAQEVDPVALSLIAHIEGRISELRAGYELSRDYYRGQHPVLLPDRVKRYLRASGDPKFRDNWCEVVVDAVAERLKIIGFEIEGSDEQASWVWDWWKHASGDIVQSVVHTISVMEGDSYVLVGPPTEQRPMPQLHFQDPAMMVPHYDPETGEIAWISKKWTWIPDIGEDPETRLNLYYPERIEKYVANNNVWARFQDGEEWPIPWVDAQGDPLGVPVFHFRNDSLGEDFGSSELNNVIPLQDLLNKLLVDLAQVADYMGFPQRYTVNLSSGGTKLDVVPGSIWEFNAEQDLPFEAGQWELADLTKLLEGIEMLVQHVAGVSRTPQHLFHLTGNWPSGEALKTAETGLVNKVQERQLDFGQSWENVLSMAMKLQNTFGTGDVPGDEGALIDITWDDPETRSDKEFLEGLAVKREKLGVPKEQLWREAGYSQQQIEQMLEDEKASRVAETNIGAAILEEFQRGEGGGFEQAGAP